MANSVPVSLSLSLLVSASDPAGSLRQNICVSVGVCVTDGVAAGVSECLCMSAYACVCTHMHS